MSRTTSRPLSSRHALVRHVANNLTERCGVHARDRLLLGVSGGADSMALLALVTAAATRLRVGIEVAHFDHALRDESADDAAFVRDRVESLGFPSMERAGRRRSPVRPQRAPRVSSFSNEQPSSEPVLRSFSRTISKTKSKRCC
jgi:3'-phosphoadenosine 5'-phosphosulfate sulfotransferase (PAPS reductase)/FAD synthetase